MYSYVLLFFLLYKLSRYRRMTITQPIHPYDITLHTLFKPIKIEEENKRERRRYIVIYYFLNSYQILNEDFTAPLINVLYYCLQCY